MKRITFLLLLTFVMVFVTACGGDQAQPTATAMPTAEPAAPSPAAATGELDALTANPWQWVSFQSPEEQFEVAMPESYLLTFSQDGTVAIVADCNNAMGSYTEDGGSLTIEVGPMTMAACPPESRSDQFVESLGAAARYFFEDGFLYIDLMADGGTMAFAAPGEGESAGDVTSYPWLWTSFTSPVEQFEVDAPENYAVTFNDDGTVNITADCNNASGSYTVEGGSLTIEVGPMTMAACPEGSRSDQFVTLLGSAARYFFEDAMLYIDLLADGGTMVFAPEGEAAMAEEEAADAAADAGIVLDPDTERVTPPPALSERERGIVEVPCALGMPTGPDEAEGETYYCGILTVPLFWDDPDSPNIDLHFIVTKASGDDPEPDPLVYLAGGPGQSSIATAILAYNQIRPTRDIVRMDQRGTGLSQRLSLEECLVLAVKDESAGDQLAVLIEFLQQQGEDTPNAPTSPESEVDFDAEVHSLCSREFTAQGMDLDAFTSEQSARDLVALMQALGYEAFNIHGESYGTRLAMTLMAMLPQIEDAPALRSVVLDSTVPPSVYLLSSLPRWDHDQVLQLLDECEQDNTCRTTYPDLAFRLGELLAQLEAEPLIAGDETITVDDLAQVLTDLSATRAGYMPLMIAELEQGRVDTYLALRDKEIGTENPEGSASFDMSDPVQAFLANSMRLLGAGGDMGPIIEFLGGVSGSIVEDDPYAAVQAYLNETYEGDTLDSLLELFAPLTPDDFEQSPYVTQLRDQAAAQGAVEELTPEEEAERQLRGQRMLALSGTAYFLNLNIHCNEDYQFESYEDGLSVYHDLAYPQLADLDFLKGQARLCETWPVATAPIEVKNPVSSTVPTLILQGAYDTRTPVYMGRRAARELENGTLVLVPQQGHEVWTNATNCAGQIATSFVLDPNAELDLSCLDARRPQWVLPEGAATATPSASASAFPPADIDNDEGGPEFVTGEMDYTYWYVTAYVEQPVVALMDVSRQIKRDLTEFIPRSGQILGRLTSPFAPSPTTYHVNLPLVPEGAYVDLDNDAEEDTGVQVYAAKVSNNLVSDSYLEQVEQLFFYNSYESDLETGAIVEGTFLVYAPDDAQGFPGAAGEDGQWFTADDPAIGLPAGYTLATFNRDGTATFDRSREAVMNTFESEKWASPDFADQGILESYESLLALLKERYAFTEERNLDWDEIRETYLPRVQEADAAGDMGAYANALDDLALSIRDAHVMLNALAVPGYTVAGLRVAEELPDNLGAGVTELSDGRFVVTTLDPEGPGAEAGWVFGTEIVTVDGVPISDRIDDLPHTITAGTQETIRLGQSSWALKFPEGATVVVEYRQPGESELQSATLTAGPYVAAPLPNPAPSDPISYHQLEGGFGYIQWTSFMSDVRYKLAVWQQFLKEFHSAPGIILDLRNNGGGSNELQHTMASFFFSPEESAPSNWIDWYEYDAEKQDIVQDVTYFGAYGLSSPVPELTYNGPVVALVNEHTASAGEYFPQLLQSQGRATVVAEYISLGGGGNIDQAKLPGGISFQFTKGRTTFGGTDELNLEAKGVQPDVRVPITLDSIQAKLDGRDPVLEAAIEVLSTEAAEYAAARLTQNPWQWTVLADATLKMEPIEDPAAYTVTFADDGTLVVAADCNQASGEYTRGDDGALSITLGPVTAAACPEGSQSEAFLAFLGAATRCQYDGDSLLIMLDPASGALALSLEPAE